MKLAVALVRLFSIWLAYSVATAVPAQAPPELPGKPVAETQPRKKCPVNEHELQTLIQERLDLLGREFRQGDAAEMRDEVLLDDPLVAGESSGPDVHLCHVPEPNLQEFADSLPFGDRLNPELQIAYRLAEILRNFSTSRRGEHLSLGLAVLKP